MLQEQQLPDNSHFGPLCSRKILIWTCITKYAWHCTSVLNPTLWIPSLQFPLRCWQLGSCVPWVVAGTGRQMPHQEPSLDSLHAQAGYLCCNSTMQTAERSEAGSAPLGKGHAPKSVASLGTYNTWTIEMSVKIFISAFKSGN